MALVAFWCLMHGADEVLRTESTEDGLRPAGADEQWIQCAPDQVAVPNGSGGYDLAPLPFDASRARTEKRAAIETALIDQFNKGFRVPFGSLSGETLQMRNDTDRTNWLASKELYQAQVDAGNGSAAGAKFRTLGNVTFDVTFAEGVQIILAMGVWGALNMQNSWALKDANDAAETEADFTLVDPASGWPA